MELLRLQPAGMDYLWGCTRLWDEYGKFPYHGCSGELLCRCKSFEVERFQITKVFSFSAPEESLQVIMCLDGEGQIEMMDKNLKPVRFVKGRCLVVEDVAALKIRCRRNMGGEPVEENTTYIEILLPFFRRH